MILRQFLHEDPIAASYLFGCVGRQAAAVVDPVGDIAPYLRLADAQGVKIRYVIDTHVHADHISPGRELASEAGAEYVLHGDAPVGFRFRRVADDEVLELGNVLVRVLHTPGHTPEHISLAVTDRARAAEPWLVFTGHTLMVGDMGRTELASSAEQGAAALFESAEKLRALPDHLQVLPGAYSGSVCGRGLSGHASSTIGFERRHNRALRVTDRTDFIRLMLADIPPRPPQAEAIRARNLAGGPTRPGEPALV
jgi:hydroxyacylglutathione hydrolase